MTRILVSRTDRDWFQRRQNIVETKLATHWMFFSEGPQLGGRCYGYHCRTQGKCDHAIKLSVCDVVTVRLVILV